MYMRVLSAIAVLTLATGTCLGDLFLDDGGFHIIEDTVTGSLYVDYDVPPSTGTSVSISGGEVMDTVYTYGTSTLLINGGSIWGGQYIEAIVASDTSQVSVDSGTLGDTIVGLNDSAFRFAGGHLQGDFIIAAGEVGSYDRSTFTFVGHSFMIDGDPAPYGTYDTGGTNFRQGSISGTLADGMSFATNYTMYDGGSIVLVPEPLTASLLVFGGLAALSRRRRRI
ncbi:MAG: PEP-CTERM sorting domain-containing protein [Phycisphaerae bacterium]